MTNSKLLVLAAGLSMACSASHREAITPSATAEFSCPGARVTNTVELERFAHCTDVRGDLHVSGVSSLSSLSSLETVSGALTIENTRELDSLSGLENLEAVKSLVLIANDDLDDISALSGLRSVATIDIVGNPELEHLSGLDNVRQLDRLRLHDNGIQTTNGLEKLSQVDDLSISHNHQLISVASLNGLTKVSRMVVQNNPRLTGFYGLFRGVQSKPSLLKFSDNIGLSAADQARFRSQFAETTTASR